jgi:hypothetical protein
MYSLIGTKNIENVYSLSATKSKINDEKDLKLAFLSFLEDFQPDVPKPKNHHINIIDDEQIEDRLAKLYAIKSKLNDKAQEEIIKGSFSKEEKQPKIRITTDALQTLKTKSKEFYSFLELIIHSVFFREADKAAGGSTSSGIGVIWLNTRDTLTAFDVAELFVHELAHNYLFIDELCNKHYNYNKINENRNYAISSILKTPRPLDKVVHSIIVSSEIILSRKSFLGENNVKIHPKTEQLIEDTNKSIKSVFEMPNLEELVTPRVVELLTNCTNQINKFSGFKNKIAI